MCIERFTFDPSNLVMCHISREEVAWLTEGNIPFTKISSWNYDVILVQFHSEAAFDKAKEVVDERRILKTIAEI